MNLKIRGLKFHFTLNKRLKVDLSLNNIYIISVYELNS